jgi:hypothetical protein
MLKTLTAGLLALLAWTMTPASAADIASKECTGNKVGCYIISITGDVTKGDGKKFTDLIQEKSITTAVVNLSSPGGWFDEGMTIARLVHQRNFETYVGDGRECMSVCAIIWIAGNPRLYTGKATIGFHGIFTAPTGKQGNIVQNGKTTPSNGGNALVGAFFNQLGLSDEAIRSLTEAAPDDVFYLNTKNINELGINAKRWEG